MGGNLTGKRLELWGILAGKEEGREALEEAEPTPKRGSTRNHRRKNNYNIPS